MPVGDSEAAYAPEVSELLISVEPYGYAEAVMRLRALAEIAVLDTESLLALAAAISQATQDA